MEKVETETHEHFAEIFEDRDKEVGEVLYAIKKEQVRSMILDEGVRPDNRKLSETLARFSIENFLKDKYGKSNYKIGITDRIGDQGIDAVAFDTDKEVAVIAQK